MSTVPNPSEDELLARVQLSCATERGDRRVNGLVDELGAIRVLGYLQAAAEVEPHWGFSIGQDLTYVDAERVLELAVDRGIRFLTPADAEWPHQLDGLRAAGELQECDLSRCSQCWPARVLVKEHCSHRHWVGRGAAVPEAHPRPEHAPRGVLPRRGSYAGAAHRLRKPRPGLDQGAEPAVDLDRRCDPFGVGPGSDERRVWSNTCLGRRAVSDSAVLARLLRIDLRSTVARKILRPSRRAVTRARSTTWLAM